MSVKKPKYAFFLRNLDIEDIHKRYGISITSNLYTPEKPEETTQISDIFETRPVSRTIPFTDEAKQRHNTMVSFVDIHNIEWGNIKPFCAWDRHVFEGPPVCCPVRYIPPQVKKVYNSEVTREEYTFRENVTKKRCKEIGVTIPKPRARNPMTELVQDAIQIARANIPTDPSDEENDRKKLETKTKTSLTREGGVYETDKAFCSFNCCLAYLLDPANKSNPLYCYSHTLLPMMYEDITGEKWPDDIQPSGHYSLIIGWGGSQSIEDFRNDIGRVQVTDFGTIRNVYQPVGQLLEQNVLM